MPGTPAEQLLLLALVLDLALGDPRYGLHPVRLLGRALTQAESVLRRFGLSGYGGGILLGLFLAALSLTIYFFVAEALDRLHPWARFAWDLFLLYSLLALGDLLRHVYRVGRAVSRNDLEAACFHVSRLAGRDTDNLDGPACNRAALESLAEGAVDGVWAPLFWFGLFGMPGLILFKVASTLDSMVGYKNDRYLRFGWFGARWDDVMNWIPARLSWIFISAAAFLLPGYSGRRAFVVGWRQQNIFPSPNSGWPEATMAGALRLRLLGPIYRDGKMVNDRWLGDAGAREGAEPGDLRRGMVLVLATTGGWVGLVLIMAGV